MKLAVIYSTIEGQTRRIAEVVAARARAAGHAVDLVDATEAGPDVLEGVDAAVLCAPVHAGRYPAALVHLARDRAARLNALPSAFVSVSLGIISEEAERGEAEAIPDRLFAESGWTPRTVHHAAGALRFSEYDFLKRWVMRLIARRHGYGSGEGDREFTDWPALEAFVDGFLTEATAAT